MGQTTTIEWTDKSWNPVSGCSKVSPGCEHCYAEAISLRFGRSAKPWTHPNAAENVVLHPERLEQPLSWRAPSKIFVNSMSDLFHDLVPDWFILNVFSVMEAAPRHTFQILTKRPERMRAWVTHHRSWMNYAAGAGAYDRRFGHVWLGVSVEDQRRAEERIPLLIQTPAAVRFLSVEPMLGPVDLSRYVCCCPNCGRPHLGTSCTAPQPPAVGWVICGGESGPHHRPFDPQWARDLRDLCVAERVPFFFKQHGGRTPKAGGRLLDGREWNEFPARQVVGG